MSKNMLGSAMMSLMYRLLDFDCWLYIYCEMLCLGLPDSK